MQKGSPATFTPPGEPFFISVQLTADVDIVPMLLLRKIMPG